MVSYFFRLLVVVLSFTSVAISHANPATIPLSEQNLVILQYHHVSNATPASTSVTPETFREHMTYLNTHFQVIDLRDALSKLKNNEPLPKKAVAITFDDGYRNILDNAHPILTSFDFPYTVFINPAIIGESSQQLTWEQVRSMQSHASFANHTLDHAHLLEMYGNENQQQWLKRVMRDIESAETLLTKEIGYSLKWLAYPYGEYNLSLKAALAENGYVGFGQQSGAISTYSDFSALPRFPAAGVYAKLDSLKVKLNSLAMPVAKVSPAQLAYTADDTLTDLQLTINNDDVRLTQFACYFQGKKLKFLGNNNQIVVKVNYTMQPGRTRINCTAPSNSMSGRYYWYSHPLFVATHTGEFFD